MTVRNFKPPEEDNDLDYFGVKDPRSVYDLETENIHLKEQMIQQMTTLEQYLLIVKHKFKENPHFL